MLDRVVSNRRKVLVRSFGSLLGLTAIGYGCIRLVARPVGIGPCRTTCGIEQAVLSAVGQPAYNLLFGLIWVGCGLALLVFLFLVYGRR